MRDLGCTYCGSSLSAMLEYTFTGTENIFQASYSEHREFMGMECNNYSCLAEWYSDGTVKVEGKPPEA